MVELVGIDRDDLIVANDAGRYTHLNDSVDDRSNFHHSKAPDFGLNAIRI